MPNIEVHCTVANCVYHKKSNLCGAPSIQVDIDQHSYTHEEFASEFGHLEHKDFAVNSGNTCCQTFRPKTLSDRT